MGAMKPFSGRGWLCLNIYESRRELWALEGAIANYACWTRNASSLGLTWIKPSAAGVLHPSFVCEGLCGAPCGRDL